MEGVTQRLELTEGQASDPSATAAVEPNGSLGVAPKPLVGRLTVDRIRRLEQLGFVWSLRDDWQKHYEELKCYKAQYGNCNVPARYAANRRLGIWVSAQRKQYKTMNQQPDTAKAQRSSPLVQERIELLNQIGFTWTIRSRDGLGESWYRRLDELKAFKAKNGSTLVPARYAEVPDLGVWVATQRTQYRLYMKAKETGADVAGAMSINESRIKELDELGFVWALRGVGKENSVSLADEATTGSCGRKLASSRGTLANAQEISVPDGASFKELLPMLTLGLQQCQESAVTIPPGSTLATLDLLDVTTTSILANGTSQTNDEPFPCRPDVNLGEGGGA